MLVQAMAAVYPDLIRAGSARAGVPAGCWADGYSSSNQWSNNCAAGSAIKTAQQWGDLVRAMYPGYTGHRPRLQTMQGDADPTISYKNTGESIEEWTNVLGLSMTPTSMDTGYKPAGSAYTFNRQFWKNSCGQQVYEAWTAPGANHSMVYEEGEILKFFGLQAANTPDPEMDCGGTGGRERNGRRGGAGGAATGGPAAERPALPGRGGTTGTAGTTGAGGRGGRQAQPERRAARARRARPERAAAPARRARPGRASSSVPVEPMPAAAPARSDRALAATAAAAPPPAAAAPAPGTGGVQGAGGSVSTGGSSPTGTGGSGPRARTLLLAALVWSAAQPTPARRWRC